MKTDWTGRIRPLTSRPLNTRGGALMRASVLLAAVSGLVSSGEAHGGLVDLEWDPARVVVTPGETVNLRLMAVSQDEIDDSMAVVEVVFLWNPDYVSLLGVLNDGPYVWFSSGFPAVGFGDLNDDLTDGDAAYAATRQPNPAPPAIATSNGLHVTTIRFEALAEASPTTVPMVSSLGAAHTRVISGEISGLVISDQLDSADIFIINCEMFDFDADGDTDLRDYAGLQRCSTMEEESAELIPCLCTFDADRNGLIEQPDYTPFAAAVTGPN